MSIPPRSFADLFTANGHHDHRLQVMHQLVANLTTMFRRDMARQMGDPRRNLEKEAGLPDLATAVSLELYHQVFARDAIANRVVSIMADESWQEPPSVYERESGKITTPFEIGWDAIGQSLSPTQSWYKQEEGSAIWPHCENADKLMGIGCHGGILLGTDDGLPLDQPAAGVVEQGSMQLGTPYLITTNAKQTKGRKLLYMREFAQGYANSNWGNTIVAQKYETNFSSPRYGWPVLYQITTGNPVASQDGTAAPTETLSVHWTRIVHTAEQDGFHTPRLQPVLNEVLGGRTVRIASGEAFWRGAFIKYFLQSPANLGGMVDVDNDSLKDAFEEMMNSSQQFMTLLGLDAKSIPPMVVDPGPHSDAQIEAICIQLGIPVRVFKGSERGELASSQDAKAWNARMRKRKSSILTPRIICPVVDRLILLGVLPQPERYFVSWPQDEHLTETEKATVLLTKTQAYATYVEKGIDEVIAPLDYMTRLDDKTEEEAKVIIKAADERQAEKDAKAAEQAAASQPPNPATGQPEPGQPAMATNAELSLANLYTTLESIQ